MPHEQRISLVLPLIDLRRSLAGYLSALEPYGYGIQHLVGFAVYALGEARGRIEPDRTYINPPQANPHTYLAHELVSVNPMITQNPLVYQQILGNAHASIEIIIRVIRALILNATRTPRTYSVLLERFLGNVGVELSVRVIEDLHGSTPLNAAPVL